MGRLVVLALKRFNHMLDSDTLGFGWKVGQGAGSHGHGIVEPIDVKLRKAKMGLQDSGERTAQSRRDFDKVLCLV